MRSIFQHAPSEAVILLVDDSLDDIVARKSVLEEWGYRVVTAGSGQEALKLHEERNPDLVITRHRMSPMDGVELISNLRRRGFEEPIILLSAFADCLGMRPEATGADIVIQKSANELAALLRHTRRLLSPKKAPPVSPEPLSEVARYSVFISHSQHDRDLAARVANLVRSTGAQVTDWCVEPDKQVQSEIVEKLRESDEMIVLVTAHSATNPWLHWEIGLAAGLEKRITPVVDIADLRELPPPLNDSQAMSTADIAPLRHRLAKRMASTAKTRQTAAVQEPAAARKPKSA
jgi:CheY-like chemotaxis protein